MVSFIGLFKTSIVCLKGPKISFNCLLLFCLWECSRNSRDCRGGLCDGCAEYCGHQEEKEKEEKTLSKKKRHQSSPSR